MRVAAVDPGGRSGWALLEFTDRLRLVEAGQIGPGDHHFELEAVLYELGELDVLIYERFEHRNNEFAELISLEYIGVCKYFGKKYDVPLVSQGASQAMHWVTDKKLESVGMLKRPLHDFKDENAAKRHAIFYLATNTKVALPVRRAVLRQIFGK